MRVYRLAHYEYNEEVFKSFYAGSLDDVKAAMREQSSSLRPDLIVDEMEMDTAKASIIAGLNGNPELKHLRSWAITARGGLRPMEI